MFEELFRRDFNTLITNANKLEEIANAIDAALDSLWAFLDEIGPKVGDYTEQLRASAQQMRDQAVQDASKVSDESVAPQENTDGKLTRDQKIAFIVDKMSGVGMPVNKYTNPLVVSKIPDNAIDIVYRAWGGKL